MVTKLWKRQATFEIKQHSILFLTHWLIFSLDQGLLVFCSFVILDNLLPALNFASIFVYYLSCIVVKSHASIRFASLELDVFFLEKKLECQNCAYLLINPHMEEENITYSQENNKKRDVPHHRGHHVLFAFPIFPISVQCRFGTRISLLIKHIG